jgi:hypothetical protein
MEEQAINQGEQGFHQQGGYTNQQGGYTNQQPTNQQGYNPDWRANLAPELQNSMQKFTDPESLARAYTGLQDLVSKKTNSFSPQDWERYAAVVSEMQGVPVSADQYQIDTTPLSEDRINTFTNEDMEAFKEISHAMGLNAQQAQGLYGVLNEMGNHIMAEQENHAVEYARSNMEELERDWGNASDSKLRAIDNCVNRILPQITGVSADRIKEEVYNSGACNSALLMKIFAAVGELGMESSSYGYNNIAPMDASMRLSQLRSDPDWVNALINKHHPRHGQAQEEHKTLLNLKNGGY